MVLTTLVAAVVMASSMAVAQYTPLTDRHYNYPDQIPYKVDTNPTDRGPQSGYNICNSTTEGQASQCQTLLINSPDDFCLWGPTEPNSLIGYVEAASVAWCSKKGHGTRIMPEGTITGLHWNVAPAYILLTGMINQANIDIDPKDDGGELDPHGADQRGNPLGGLVYSNSIQQGNTNANSYEQVIEWHNFLGTGQFCFKICRPDVANSKQYCNNIFDRTGCDFVAPANYDAGTFEMCEADNQDPVGVYTSNGQVLTYKQPAEGVPIETLPSVRTPSSSNCKTFASSALFTDAVANTNSAGTTTAGGSMTTGASDSGSASDPFGSLTSSAGAVLSSATTSNAAAVPLRMQSLEHGFLASAGPLVAIAFSVCAGFAVLLVL